MNKQALVGSDVGLAFEHMTPAQLLLYSSLVGGGTYGTLRLLHELRKSFTPEKETSTIKIDAPRRDMAAAAPVEKVAEVSDKTLKIVAALAGLPLGFHLTSSAFGAAERKRQEEKAKQLEAQYQAALQTAQTKQASDTPAVDALCESLLAGFEKQADLWDFVRTPWNAVVPHGDVLPKAKPSMIDVGQDLGEKFNKATGGMPSDMLSIIASAAILSSPLFYLGIKRMAEKGKKEKPAIPQVELNSAQPDLPPQAV